MDSHTSARSFRPGAVPNFISVPSRRAAIKDDFAQVNSIKYGLLSVDVWRDRIQEVVSGSINEFALSRGQENDLKKRSFQMFSSPCIDETDGLLQKRRRTLSEKIRKMVVSTFFDTSDLRKKVPALTQSIVDEIKKPKNKEKIKHLAQTQLNTYSAESYNNDDNLAPVNRTLAKYQTDTTKEFNRKTKDEISTLDSQAFVYSSAMLICLFLFLILGWRLWRDVSVRKLLFTIGLGFAFLFLLTALSTPMMEIDARINKVDIVFVGKHLLFEDQVLFTAAKVCFKSSKRCLIRERKAPPSSGYHFIVQYFLPHRKTHFRAMGSSGRRKSESEQMAPFLCV